MMEWAKLTCYTRELLLQIREHSSEMKSGVYENSTIREMGVWTLG